MTTPDNGPVPATDRLAAFKRCQAAEEYFQVLDVPYDQKVINVNRLHILRHFAGQLMELHLRRDSPEEPERLLRSYSDALTRSYEVFTTGTALDHRVFKVLRDRAPAAFVPATAVTVPAKPQGARSC